jgi:hypothetical protein
MTAQFVGPKDDVKKSSSIQVVEILCLVFYLIGLPRALIDEAPHRLRVGCAQAVLLPQFLVLLKLRIGGGDKVPAAKCFAFKHRRGCLFTARDTALFSVRHLRKTRSAFKTTNDLSDNLAQDVRPTVPLVSSFRHPSQYFDGDNSSFANSATSCAWFEQEHTKRVFLISLKTMVDVTGIEPATPCLQRRERKSI